MVATKFTGDRRLEARGSKYFNTHTHTHTNTHTHTHTHTRTHTHEGTAYPTVCSVLVVYSTYHNTYDNMIYIII